MSEQSESEHELQHELEELAERKAYNDASQFTSDKAAAQKDSMTTDEKRLEDIRKAYKTALGTTRIYASEGRWIKRCGYLLSQIKMLQQDRDKTAVAYLVASELINKMAADIASLERVREAVRKYYEGAVGPHSIHDMRDSAEFERLKTELTRHEREHPKEAP